MPASKAQPAPTAEQAEIDRYCVLVGECLKVKWKFDEKDELRKKILARYPDLAADATATAEGSVMDALVTVCDLKREVTPAGKRKLFALWKAGEFFRRCDVTLKQLPGGKDPKNRYSSEARVGPRHVLPLPKPLKKAA